MFDKSDQTKQTKTFHDGCVLILQNSEHLKATGLVLPSPNTRDSVMSMLSERIIGTMCLNREEGDGVPTIYGHKQRGHVRSIFRHHYS